MSSFVFRYIVYYYIPEIDPIREVYLKNVQQKGAVIEKAIPLAYILPFVVCLIVS